MTDRRSELSQSPIKIPEHFHQVLYNYDRYPGAPGVRGLVGGANCQQYAYEFLREFGYTIPDFRRELFDCGLQSVNDAPNCICRAFSAGVLLTNFPRPRKLSLGYYLSRLRR